MTDSDNGQSFDQTYDSYFDESNHQAAYQEPDNDSSSEESEAVEVEEPTIITKEQDESEPNSGENESLEEAQEQEDSKKDISNNLKAALKEERGKRQELERQFKAQMEESKQIREALNELLNPKQQQQAQPDYNEDPVGYLKWQQDQISNNQLQQQQFLQQQQQQQQAYQNAVSMNNEYMQEKQVYAQQNPDFDNAANFLESSVLNEYKALGYNDQQASQLLIQDKLALLSTAKEKGLSAPQLIEQIARARGYTKQQTQQKPNLESIKKGMQKGKSLGSAGGQASKNTLSFKDIGNLSDNEWEGFWDKYKKGNLQIS